MAYYDRDRRFPKWIQFAGIGVLSLVAFIVVFLAFEMHGASGSLLPSYDIKNNHK